MNTISNRIATRLNELKLKQVDLMEATGLSKGAISKWIAGTSIPSSEHIPSIAKKLEVSTEWLLTGKETSQYKSKPVNQLNSNYTNNSINQSVTHQYSNKGKNLIDIDFYPQANLNASKQVFCTTTQTIPINVDFVTVAIDDLMHPVIRQKSLVAVSKLQDGDLIYPNKIYVLNMHGLLICRYLEQITGGRMRVYNEKNQNGLILSQEEFYQEYQVMGGVVWWSSLIEW